jgi:tRNA G37 N-methylase Trm5
MDKNPTIQTVINKVDDVGTNSEYRTFGYEVLAGPDDMIVELSEENCIFRFDYSKVYWNSRLQTEHKRLVDSFNPGEVVCDVMAGVGPFAIPAGKKGVFVWANDLNPDSYAAMLAAVHRNKVSAAPLLSSSSTAAMMKRSSVLYHLSLRRALTLLIKRDPKWSILSLSMYSRYLQHTF